MRSLNVTGAAMDLFDHRLERFAHTLVLDDETWLCVGTTIIDHKQLPTLHRFALYTPDKAHGVVWRADALNEVSRRGDVPLGWLQAVVGNIEECADAPKEMKIALGLMPRPNIQSRSSVQMSFDF